MFTGLFIDSFQISPYIDQSSTDLTWNIAAGPGSNFSPNVLSEISFDGVKIRGGGVAIVTVRPTHLLFIQELGTVGVH